MISIAFSLLQTKYGSVFSRLSVLSLGSPPQIYTSSAALDVLNECDDLQSRGYNTSRQFDTTQLDGLLFHLMSPPPPRAIWNRSMLVVCYLKDRPGPLLRPVAPPHGHARARRRSLRRPPTPHHPPPPPGATTSAPHWRDALRTVYVPATGARRRLRRG